MNKEIFTYVNNDNWTDQEFSEIKFGDERLKLRFLKIARQLSKKSESPINQACEDWADTKAAYRFFDNPKVSSDKIIHEHCKRTKTRSEGLDTVLAIQDTCYLSYSKHPKTEGLCKIRPNVKGLVMHTVFCLSTNGLPIGILYQNIWSRKPNLKKSRNYRFVPIEEKEPFKWIRALRESVYILNSQEQKKKIISIADREADVFEFMIEHKNLETSFIIRAKSNRPINKDKKRSKTKENLWEHMEKIKPSIVVEITVPEKKGQPKRIAKTRVTFSQVKFQPPTNKTRNKDGNLNSLEVNVIFVKEIDPPINVEPLEWMLLTDIHIEKIEDAIKVIDYYKMRWAIEDYHKILKSGCTIESCRLQKAERLVRYISLMSIIAWRLYYITHISRVLDKNSSCTNILADYEWKALYLKINPTKPLPNEPPTIEQVIRWIGKLGGFLGRKNDYQPGITVIWRGWMRFTEIVDDYLLFSNLKLCG